MDCDQHYVGVPLTPKVAPATTKAGKLSLLERYARDRPFSEQPNPLRGASLVSKVATQWFQPLITLGAQKVIEREDVWPVAPEDSCDALQQRFAHYYNDPAAESTLGIPKIAIALIKTFRTEIAIMYANHLVYIGTMVLQPYIAQALLDFLNDRENLFRIDSGLVLVAMMTVVSLVGVTCLNYGFFTSSRIGVNMRALVMDIVYQKSLRLSSVARQAYSTGDITTLMSVDAERVFYGIVFGPWVLISPFAFVVTAVLLGLMFDVVSATCGAALLALVLYVSIRLADRTGDVQEKLLEVVDERVKVTSEALQGIRVMKFYAWEESLARRVERIRSVEVSTYRVFHYLQIANVTLLFLTPAFLCGLVLGLFVMLRGNVTVTETYTLINIVNICRSAVNMFPLAVSAMSQARVALNRLDVYLRSDELDKEVIMRGTAPCSSDQSRGTISVRNAHFEWSSSATQPTDTVIVRSIDAHDENQEGLDAELPAKPTPGFSMEGINIEIDAGALVMIVGTVGSGKSSLLSALLGEMARVDGSAAVNGDVSYVGQEAWIRNSTVRGNILFETEIDPERYQQIIQATQLAQDVDALPDGDQTEIGERGINLSGGQKARVAIARAMYRRHYDILILDDPLSAVDPHVAHAIFHECIVGLAGEKTRLLVLNSHYDLLPFADKILMVQDGRIAGEGTYAEVTAQFPALKEHAKVLNAKERDALHEENLGKNSSVQGGSIDGESEPLALDLPIAVSPDNGKSKRLVQDEDRVRGRVSGQTYKSYFDETGFNGYVVVVVVITSYTVSHAARILVDWWQGHWAKEMPRDSIDPSYSGLWYGMWYLGFILICSVLTIGRGLILMEACVRSSKNLHDELFRRVLRAPVNLFFDVTPTGRILNRFSNDLDQVDSVLPIQYQTMLQTLAILIGCLVVSALASYWIIVSYLPMLLVFVVTGLYFKKTSRELKRLEGITRTPVFNLFGETLNGLQTIRAFRMQNRFAQLNKDAIDTNTSLYFSYWAAGRWLAVRLDWLSVVVIFVLTLYLVISKGQIDSVVAGISLSYSLMLTSMIQWFVRSADQTDNAMTSVERLLYFREIPVEEPEASRPINQSAWPSAGAIRFDKLRLRYRPELPLVLRGVDLDIQAGEKIGICGRTGAGKSSLMIGLFRICEFESGTIFIDGVDISTLALRDLRSNLAIIPQDPVMYSGSLRENLDPFGTYSDEAIWTVLQQVHLFDTISRWGAGLDFVVSERGDNLSVGQRQLLCIGRALLKDSRIVVLDEATANVDSATDSLIQATIRDTFTNKTVLTIAHRIHTIMHCNKIAVMDAGRVVEFGTPSYLLSQPSSTFAALASKSTTE